MNTPTHASTHGAALRPSARITLVLCAAAALCEGFDNQSMGVAAPKLLAEFGLSAVQAGVIFSAATLGLFVGAAIGGWISDHVGRKRTLTVSLLMFGLFSLLTAWAPSITALCVARLLTGLGLGGAMPNFIALSSEAARPERRLATVTIVMAGLPLGGALAGLMALGDRLGWGWRSIFVVGGTAPIVLALIIGRALSESPGLPARNAVRVPEGAPPGLPRGDAVRLPEGAPPRLRRDNGVRLPTHDVPSGLPPGTGARPATRATPPFQGVLTALFGRTRALTTVLLWIGFFFTHLVLLLLLNWLPSLMIGLGFARAQASLASICFNLSGSVGAVFLGRQHAGSRRRQWVLATYGGMVLALSGVALVGRAFAPALLACSFAGVFIIGAQLILFALAPLYYERANRGTGVGAAVAMGRLGSIVGPLFAAGLLARGGGSATVLLGIVPFVLIGGAAALGLTWRAQCRD